MRGNGPTIAWCKDPAGLQRVTHEVWQMKKLDLAKLQKAFTGK